MIVAKDGMSMELNNESHIEAFLSSGWVEVKASALPAEEPKAEEIEEIMPAPIIDEGVAVEDEKPAAPKRGRKKQVK